MLDFILVFWRKKYLVAGLSLGFSVLSATHAILEKPIYEYKVVLQSPGAADISDLNYGRGVFESLPRLEPKDVYQAVARKLQSEGIRQEVYEKIYLPSLPANFREADDASFSSFSRRLVVTEVPYKSHSGKNDTPGKYVILVRDADPVRAKMLLQAFVRGLGDEVRDELVKQVEREAEVLSQSLDRQISAVRSVARKQREDLIAALSQALITAKSLDNGSFSNGLAGSCSEGTLYLRGEKNIKDEVDRLKNSQDNLSDFEGFEAVEIQRDYYRNLRVHGEGVRVFEEEEFLPVKGISPVRKVIVYSFFGFFMGLTLALLIVFGCFIFNELKSRLKA